MLALRFGLPASSAAATLAFSHSFNSPVSMFILWIRIPECLPVPLFSSVNVGRFLGFFSSIFCIIVKVLVGVSSIIVLLSLYYGLYLPIQYSVFSIRSNSLHASISFILNVWLPYLRIAICNGSLDIRLVHSIWCFHSLLSILVVFPMYLWPVSVLMIRYTLPCKTTLQKVL